MVMMFMIVMMVTMRVCMPVCMLMIVMMIVKPDGLLGNFDFRMLQQEATEEKLCKKGAVPARKEDDKHE